MHTVDPRPWGPAQVTYPDWQGNAQIDEKKTGTVSMYSLTGIDQDEWSIIGLDWGGGESGWQPLHVIAVPAGTDLDAPTIQATDFYVHDVDVNEFLLAIMHVSEFRLRTRRTVDANIVIVAEGDSPEQD